MMGSKMVFKEKFNRRSIEEDLPHGGSMNSIKISIAISGFERSLNNTGRRSLC